MKLLLVVEPTGQSTWGDRLQRALAGTGWQVCRSSPAEARRAALSTAALVVVLTDAALAASPGLLPALATATRAPVVVAGRDDRQAELVALRAGAAAYFRPEQPDDLLVARLEALLRKHPFRPVLGRLPKRLGPQERALAHALLAHRGPLDRLRAVEVLWGGFASESAYRVGLLRLRRKLAEAGLLVEVRPGLGARILVAAEAAAGGVRPG